MASIRVDAARVPHPAEVGWEEAKSYRYDCGVMTSLLHAQVPVLDFVEWTVTTIEPGLARTVLPLISPSTNQHCTHQAAILFLSADYTGGIALASLLPGWPILGVHPVAPLEVGMALWLVKGEIQYFRPSVGRLDISAQVEPERHDRVKRRFAQGKPVVERVVVRFCNGPVSVAEATMIYYVRRSDALRADGVAPEKCNILYQHKLVSSAELIAGVRAREAGGLFEDPSAARIAGEHGIALAARFCEKLPQLGGMVAARTRHLDGQILEFARNGGRDVILLGVGYDMRPFRLRFPAGMRVYELDFPTVLADRQRRLDECGVKEPEGLQRIRVPIDLRATPLAAAMEGIVDLTGPVFVACEGMSMYFEESEVRRILQGISPLLSNNRSRLWLDCVDEQVIVNPGIFPEVKQFMHGMQLLGEPFVFGMESVHAFMESAGFHCHEVVPSDVFLLDQSDPVYSFYHFCVASPEASPADGSAAGDSARFVAHPSHAVSPPAAVPEQPVRKSVPSV
jgi:methyltransferase (TIGR00027 family)